MPILNYTTSIATEKTAAEIQKKLAGAKAQAVMSEYDDSGIMVAMSFRVMTPHGMIMFRLPVNIRGVYKAMCEDGKVPRRLRTEAQASRVAWRIMKDWVEAQLAIIDSDMAELTEVFLPYAQNQVGQTLYESLKENGFKALTHEGGGS